MRGIARRFIRLRELTAFPPQGVECLDKRPGAANPGLPTELQMGVSLWREDCMGRKPMRKLVPLLAAAVVLPTAVHAAVPARPARSEAPGILRQLNGALSQLADRVSPAVVQVQVSGYGLSSSDDGRE